MLANQAKHKGNVNAVDRNGKVDEKLIVLKSMGLAMYYDILETAKSILLIFAFLAFYKVSGLNDWWINLIDMIN
jgi:hypothetical protein